MRILQEISLLFVDGKIIFFVMQILWPWYYDQLEGQGSGQFETVGKYFDGDHACMHQIAPLWRCFYHLFSKYYSLDKLERCRSVIIRPSSALLFIILQTFYWPPLVRGRNNNIDFWSTILRSWEMAQVFFCLLLNGILRFLLIIRVKKMFIFFATLH